MQVRTRSENRAAFDIPPFDIQGDRQGLAAQVREIAQTGQDRSCPPDTSQPVCGLQRRRFHRIQPADPPQVRCHPCHDAYDGQGANPAAHNRHHRTKVLGH